MATTMEREQVLCTVCGSPDSKEIASGRDYIYHGSDEYFSHVECRRCGHIYLSPRPKPSEISVMYPANYGTFSDKFKGRANLLGAIKQAVNVRRFSSVAGDISPGARILDVGCGNGELLRALAAKRPDLELYGLDWYFPPETRRNLEAEGIRLVEARLEDAPLPAEHFDLILMYQLIEHLWDPRACLNHLHGALKPGGRIAIETPNTDGYDRKWFVNGCWGGYYVPRHLNLYNFARLKLFLTECRFEVLAQRDLPAPIIWCYSCQAAIQEHFGQGKLLERVFEPRNVAALGCFAACDVLAILIGARTSNQQAVARRR